MPQEDVEQTKGQLVAKILQKNINAALLCWEWVKFLKVSDQSSQDLCRTQFTLLRKHEPDATIGKMSLTVGKNPFSSQLLIFFFSFPRSKRQF